ncbi:MAG: flexitail domain-containing putative surface protein [Dehalococcoidia bacterium]
MRPRTVVLCCALIAAVALVGAIVVSTRSQPARAAGPTAVDAGFAHSCAITSAGAVRCWGANASGQVGDGSVDDRQAPEAVFGLASGITDVALGSGHTCALTTAGGVKCWGNNTVGQVGDDTGVERHMPADVTGLSGGVTAITAGLNHACALLDTGGVRCWGDNTAGELGTGTNGNISLDPMPVCASGSGAGCNQLTGVVAIGAGDFHTCAVLSTGGLKCWGLNEYGQIGDGTAGDSNPETLDQFSVNPTSVVLFGGTATSVSGGDGHTCALNTGGLVQCWGLNNFGQLGDGTLSNHSLPITVDLKDLAALDAGEVHSCALTNTGAAKCWGGNGDGRLGDGTTTDRPLPVGVSGLGSGATDIAAGGAHTCALAAASVACWGANASGQLGSGTTKGSTTPVMTLGGWPKDPTPTATSSPTETPSPTQTHTPTPTSTRTPTSTPGSSTPTRSPTPVDTPTPTDTVEPGVDSDGDGCDDARELGPNPSFGGGRDPGNVWDFFDTPDDANVRDRAITVGDLGRVVARFGSSGSKALDPLSTPPPAPAYHTAFDRTSPGEAPNGHPQGPNGSVTAQDIALVVAQFGHSCA